MRQREEWIDLTKGTAILLVVLGHVINSYIVADMFIPYIKYLKYSYFSIYSFHMPLFFMLSGYLYINRKPDNNLKNYKNFVIKKIIALGIPYIIFSIAQGSVQILFSSVTHNHLGISALFNILLYPILQFWFLYALLLIFIFVPLLDLLVKNNEVVASILFILKVISFIFVTNIFPVDTLLSNAFYFYCGVLLFKYKSYIINNKSLLFIASLSYVLLNILCYFIFDNIYNINIIKNSADILLALCGSLFIIYLIINLIQRTTRIRKALNILGIYSFEIYLLHIVFSYGVKTILVKLEVKNLFIHLFLGTLIGVIIPISIGYIDRKIPSIYYIFYPHKLMKVKNCNMK